MNPNFILPHIPSDKNSRKESGKCGSRTMYELEMYVLCMNVLMRFLYCSKWQHTPLPLRSSVVCKTLDQFFYMVEARAVVVSTVLILKILRSVLFNFPFRVSLTSISLEALERDMSGCQTPSVPEKPTHLSNSNYCAEQILSSHSISPNSGVMRMYVSCLTLCNFTPTGIGMGLFISVCIFIFHLNEF
jgi:hypothetical protein